MSAPARVDAVPTLRIDAEPTRSLAQEARRQSLLVSHQPSEGETLGFIEQVADTGGWAPIPAELPVVATPSERPAAIARRRSDAK